MHPTIKKDRFRRNAISLIEVIACMGIASIMMMPIAGVMRASNQAIVRAESQTPQAELRDASAWLRHFVQDNQIIEVRPNALVLRRTSGEVVQISVDRRRNTLITNEGNHTVDLMAGVQTVEFERITQAASPSKLIGLKISVEVTGAADGQTATHTSLVSVPPNL
jgi:hypothetical protein